MSSNPKIPTYQDPDVQKFVNFWSDKVTIAPYPFEGLHLITFEFPEYVAIGKCSEILNDISEKSDGPEPNIFLDCYGVLCVGIKLSWLDCCYITMMGYDKFFSTCSDMDQVTPTGYGAYYVNEETHEITVYDGVFEHYGDINDWAEKLGVYRGDIRSVEIWDEDA